MIAADKGIGLPILSAADLMRSPQLLFGLIVLSSLGLVLVWVLERLKTRLIAWE